MKKIFTFLTGLLAVLINFTAGAQQPADSNKSLLWKISGRELSKPSYLFGTMHMICKDDYLWTDKMKTTLDKSEKVCFEMDLDDNNIMMQIATGLMDHSGKSLKDYFSPEQYKLVSAYVRDSAGMDIAMFEHMKPVALQTLIATKSGTCNNQVSYEETIMKTAVEGKKEILGLEEPKEQLEALESIPTDSVIKELMQVISGNNKSDDAEYTELIAAYKAQDIPTLYSLITATKELGEDMGPLLDDRNKRWIGRMQKKMKPSSVFFAVGAGHLWGDKGVINLLRKEGYKVEALR